MDKTPAAPAAPAAGAALQKRPVRTDSQCTAVPGAMAAAPRSALSSRNCSAVMAPAPPGSETMREVLRPALHGEAARC
jgi:hypothetical protein